MTPRIRQRGGIRICRIAELINDKAGKYSFPIREIKNKSGRSLEDVDINYNQRYEDKAEDDKPALSELDSVFNIEPILEELV